MNISFSFFICQASKKNDTETLNNTSFEFTNTISQRIKEAENEFVQKNKGSSLPPEFYHRLIEVENELQQAKRTISLLEEERRRQDVLLREGEAKHEKERAQWEASRSQSFSIESAAEAENRIQLLARQLQDCQHENQSLCEVQRIKTKAIEELALQLEERTATDETLNMLKQSMASKEKDIVELIEENTKLIQLVTIKDEQLEEEKKKNEKPGIPFAIWNAEREILKKQLEQTEEEKRRLEESLKRQQQHLDTMKHRVDFVAKTGMKPSPMKSRSSLTSQMIRETSQANISADGVDMVPGKMLEMVESKVKQLEFKLVEKERSILEKTQAISRLETQISVLKHSKESSEKTSQTSSKQNAIIISQLKERIDKLTSDYIVF